MIDYLEILRLNNLGYSQRTIETTAHCSRHTVREVLAEMDKHMMKVIVEDDGVGMPPDVLDKMRAALEEERQPTNQPDTHGNGIAMYNVNQRIKLAFGRDYGLFVYSTENLGTDVEIWMPKVYTKEELLMQ